MRRRIRYRITRGGLLFTLAVLMVATAAVLSANNLMYLILATMMATLLVSGFISRLCLAGLELDLTLPEHISTGRAARAKLFVRNLKGWMPSFSIQVTGVPERALAALGRPLEQSAILTMPVYFPVIPGGATLEESVDVKFDRRGTQRQNTFVFATRFPKPSYTMPTAPLFIDTSLFSASYAKLLPPEVSVFPFASYVSFAS